MTPYLTEADLRAAIVAEFLSWEGTPYHHLGDVKGREGGVDCAMILVRGFQNLELLPADLDPRPYPIDWHVHRDIERYLLQVSEHAKETDGPPQPGDVRLYKFGRTFSHSAVVIEWPMVIHAFMRDRMVVRADETKFPLAGREAKTYTMWEARI